MTFARIKIKALSVNSGFQGRRFKNRAYKDYEEAVLYLLPRKLEIPPGRLELDLRVGLSSKNADVDNCTKFFTDILCKRYGFNDKRIWRLVIEREEVKKGSEFIEFLIKSLT